MKKKQSVHSSITNDGRIRKPKLIGGVSDGRAAAELLALVTQWRESSKGCETRTRPSGNGGACSSSGKQ